MSARLGEQWRNDATGITVVVAKVDGATVAMGDSSNTFVNYPPSGYTKVAVSPTSRCDSLDSRVDTTETLVADLQARLTAAGIP